ncbi:hypothetical protein [Micromonospora sp. CB01531]|nr:hypothetical protein [Micromonospora sp. CB01531]
MVVEVLTDQVQHLAGRDMHQLRAGGPHVRRADGPAGAMSDQLIMAE